MNLRSPLRRLIARLRDWRHREDAPVRFRVGPLNAVQPPVPAAYLPLFTYLDRRYAATVVLTFEQIESLLGFVPPSPAFADAEWWTHSEEATDRHGAAWAAARRSAAPQLRARIVAFERLP
jgi:hypothetical protein